MGEARLMPRTLPEGVRPLTVAERQRRFKQRQADLLAHARASYHNPTFPPRQCLHCGTDYTGPAVYCSLDCALADAQAATGATDGR